MNLHRRLLTAIWNGDDEAGQSMVEYAIVTALIAVVALVAVQTLGDAIVAVFEGITSTIASV